LLTSVSFSYDAPTLGSDPYSGSPNVINYVLSAIATGWGDTFGGRPVVFLDVTANDLTVYGTTKLEALTDNGFVKTSGGDGTLEIDTDDYTTFVETTNIVDNAVADYTLSTDFIASTNALQIALNAAIADDVAGTNAMVALIDALPTHVEVTNIVDNATVDLATTLSNSFVEVTGDALTGSLGLGGNAVTNLSYIIFRQGTTNWYEQILTHPSGTNAVMRWAEGSANTNVWFMEN